MAETVADVCIIGSGAVGAAAALALAGPQSVIVLEKERGPALHTSGRNSGVLHSGINPKPGTLKAKLCVEGNRLARKFCQDQGVPCEPVGTLVVATSEAEEETLAELEKRGRENGAPNLRMLTGTELREREPQAAGRSALFSPSGCIVDSRAFVSALVKRSEANGARYFFGRKVKRAADHGSEYEIETATGEVFRARQVLNCAGLYADKIARLFGAGDGFTIVPFRGQYWKLKAAKRGWVRSMLYPAPDLRYPFLGVHWTRTVTGDVLAGPNAVLAFGRESYTFWAIHFAETARMAADPRFWKMIASKEFRALTGQQMRIALSRSAFAEAGARILPGITSDDLEPYNRAGNRPQLVNRAGHLVDDIVIEKKGRSLHVLNAVSPGFTCSLPFGDYLRSQLQ